MLFCLVSRQALLPEFDHFATPEAGPVQRFVWKEPLNVDNNEVPVDAFDMNSLFYEPGQRSYMRDHVAYMVRKS